MRAHRSTESLMRFLPNRHASMDHAPGPIIANPAANVAWAIALLRRERT